MPSFELTSLLTDLPVEDFIVRYGYLAVFAIIGLESAGVPLPGEITLVTASIIAGTTGHLDIALVLLAAVAGAVLGDNAGYWIGREFGFRFLYRHGERIGIGQRQLKLGQYLFLRHGGKVVFFGRLFALLRVLAALLAGVNRMPWGHFLACNIGGALMWAALYGGGAYLLGGQVRALISGPGGLITLGIGVALFLIGARYIRHHQRKLEDLAEQALPGPLQPEPLPHLPHHHAKNTPPHANPCSPEQDQAKP